LSLESKIYEVTGIKKSALRGDVLSNFNIKERRSWAEDRKTTVEEDATYYLVGVFGVSIVPNYGEGKDHAFRRLDDEIHRMYKGKLSAWSPTKAKLTGSGIDFEQYAVGLNLASFPEAAQFVAREKELSKMHELLYGYNNRACVVLYDLGGIGKTQLAIKYIKRHKEKYIIVFWLNANDQDFFKFNFRDIAQQILKYYPLNSLLIVVDLDDLDQVIYAVKTWLDLLKNTYWLIIYNNYNNPKISGNFDRSTFHIRQFLLQSDQDSIIITTRFSQISQGYSVHIQKLLNIEESFEILSYMSRRKNIVQGMSYTTELFR